jgi:hypothetical protein
MIMHVNISHSNYEEIGWGGVDWTRLEPCGAC